MSSKDFIMSIIRVVIFLVGLICIFILMAKGEYALDEKVYNNNVCSCCGEEEAFELFDVEHIKNSGTIYYYKCKNCDYLIEIHHKK